MEARVKVYAPDGVTARTADVGQGAGILPTIDLQFSAEVGGAGGCQFTALADDLDALSARDSVIHVQVFHHSTWTSVAAYALRPPFRREKVGFQRVQCTGVALLEQWASETVVLPEYGNGTMPRGAGTDRAIGWMSSAYNPATDPNEPWNAAINTGARDSSVTYPQGWVTASGAEWLTATGNPFPGAERKLYRSTLTVPGSSPTIVTGWFTADEGSTVYLGGEIVLQTSYEELGKYEVEKFSLTCFPGTYAIAVENLSHAYTGGGDPGGAAWKTGVDPFMIALATFDDDGNPIWLNVSDEADWYACRRDDEPPDNEPPGPTPGALLGYLLNEAQGRNATGWGNVTLGFSATVDSHGQPWSTYVIERQVRYGSDTYWSVLQMLAECDEADVWLTPGLVLHAAPSQGRTTSVTLDTSDIVTMSDSDAPDEGTWVAALAMDGWITAAQGSPRREFGMEIGTAISRAVAGRVVSSALAENGRWDGSCRLAPGAPVPLIDFGPGDTIGLTYADAPTSVVVLSMSAAAGESGLAWDLELAEVPS